MRRPVRQAHDERLGRHPELLLGVNDRINAESSTHHAVVATPPERRWLQANAAPPIRPLWQLVTDNVAAKAVPRFFKVPQTGQDSSHFPTKRLATICFSHSCPSQLDSLTHVVHIVSPESKHRQCVAHLRRGCQKCLSHGYWMFHSLDARGHM